MYKFTLLLLALLLCQIASGQKAVSKQIQNLKSSGYKSTSFDLLNFQTNDLQNRNFNLSGLKKGTIVNLDKNAIQSLFQGQNDFINITVPLSSRTNITLTLKRHEIFAPDFKLFTSSDPEKEIEYTPGLHYMGVVEGDPASIVALSVFDDQVIGLISTDEGNFIIGPIKEETTNRHIIYNDRDLEEAFDFSCGTEDDDPGYTEAQQTESNSRDANDCVRLHIEIDHNIVVDKGGAVNATNYVTAMFNQSFLIYANESINMVISEIKAWATVSPYVGATQSEMLSSYKYHTEFFNGDISQLVTYSAVGGSAAGTSGLCNGNPDLSKCFSHIDSYFNDFPVYSWTVFVITHENGHLLGSSHTHSCVWNGNNTAIDGCYTPAGSCPQPPIPPDGGTIMSYCYLASSGSFVDFNLGFGPQPGQRIRNSVNAASNCLSVCGNPTDYCASNGATSSIEFIDKVLLGSINNLSGNNGGYGNFTSLNTILTAGSTYTITLTPKFTGGNKIKYWRIWIDYNQDFDWYDNGEMVGQGSGNNTINLTFTVPANTVSYTTRMRVSMRYQGYHTACGTFPAGEVEDYNVVISGIPVPTCSDGIQNQGETEVDCGGPCDPCPPSCTDGILNQDETNVDCGGICPACPSCDDGIQNQSETGIDCGGPCSACPPPDSIVLLGSYFETGMDSWIDGGSDAARVNSANSYEGLYSIRLADNSGTQSAMTSPVFNLSDAVGVQIQFHFYAYSMEAGENFFVLYNNGSGTWNTVASLVSGAHFTNNSFHSVLAPVPGFVPTSAGSFRIQCDASDNNDQIFIDAVTITKLTGLELIQDNVLINRISDHQSNPTSQILLYPNPARDLLYIKTEQKIDHINIVNVNGQDAGIKVIGEAMASVDISSLNAGLYIVFIRSGNQITTSRFVKL